ncbi:ribonuclease P protein subunit p30 [Vespa velutina]|uniref:ribonuclease P protein subunit p30 n=1 Tax=Vespa velutina TaxID=202808 RepID=UPI001FB2D120|nr:ribonuclease P protein subunit p30 [Vespa velutina]XP_047355773.1 ribonuclease P protein subunit p30 [Vespa velutina]
MDVKLSDGYFDLCINATKDNMSNLHSILLRLCQMGFRTVAINQTIDDSIFDTDKKKKKKKSENNESSIMVPNPLDIDDLVKEFKDKLRIFNRLTFIYSDPLKTHILNHCNSLKKFHLYSVIPKTKAALQFACSQLNADIITINASCTEFKMNRKLYLQAVERDVHFEIQYTDILNPEQRKVSIHYAHLFYVYGKSKNVIISSGASNVTEIRNPYDIINLGALLGLNEIKSKAAILYQSKHLLLRAERRRYGKVFAIRIEEKLEEDNHSESNAKKLKL